MTATPFGHCVQLGRLTSSELNENFFARGIHRTGHLANSLWVVGQVQVFLRVYSSVEVLNIYTLLRQV